MNRRELLGAAMATAPARLLGAKRRADRRLLREVNLSKWVKEPPHLIGPPFHPVCGLSFSPDESRVAAAFGNHATGREFVGHLLTLPIDPQALGYQSVEVLELGVAPPPIWSPGGDMIIYTAPIDMGLIRTDSGCRCELPLSRRHFILVAGFVGRDHFVLAERDYPNYAAGLSRLILVDSQCRVVESLTVKGRISTVDAAPAAGLVCAGMESGRRIVVDVRARKIVDEWQAEHLSQVKFLASGKVVCEVRSASSKYPSPTFREVGMKDIDRRPRISGWRPFSVASNGALVAVCDTRYSYNWFTEAEKEVVRRIVLYDYRGGEELLSWKPSFQVWGTEYKQHVPFVFALSPSGRLLAEGGDDTLRIYSLELA